MATALSVLAGQDGPDRRALPVGEFFHPAPLAALALLAANDWWLKGAGLLPAAVTGKLSDFAGVVFFPLLVTALVGVGRLGARRLGQNIDPSLSVARLAVAVWATGLLMVAIKTTPAAAAAVEAALGAVGIAAHIVVDPTDLVCLPALAVPWLVGCAHIARLPLGRLEVLVDDYANWRLASAAAIEVELSDLISCGATSDAVGDLAGAVAAYVDRKDINGLERALAALRD